MGQIKVSANILDKSLVVLNALINSGCSQPLSEIAEKVNMPRQTVYRITHQLERSGLVRKGIVTDEYSVGPQLRDLCFNVFSLMLRSLPVNGVLRNLVKDLGETCNLGILDCDEIVYLERVECDWPLRLQFGPGSRVPVHATAIGKLMLAYLPSRIRMRIFKSAPLKKFTDHTITDINELNIQLKKIRRQGFAVNSEENLVGMVAAAVPVHDKNRRVLAGLAVHVPVARMTAAEIEQYIPLLREASFKISDFLAETDNLNSKI